MNKPEYGDLYKFIASVGVVLISLALVLPWLMLRESFDVLHSTAEISAMTQTAQEVIAYRQGTALWWVQNVGWFSGGLGIIGLVTLVAGVYFWRRKQQVADKKENLEVQKLERDLTPMKPEQIAEKTIKEGEEAVAFEVPILNILEGEAEKIPLPIGMQTVVSEIFNFERTIAQKIASCFGQERVLTNQRIGGTEYDIILAGSKSADSIFNIKYRRSKVGRRTIEETINQAVDSLHVYQLTTLRRANVIILFIAPELGVSQRQLEELTIAQLTEEDRAMFSVSTKFIKPEGVKDISCEQLRYMVVPTY